MKMRPTITFGFVTVGYGLYRRWQLRWGATDEEVDAAMPGDGVVPRPWFSATRALTIAAPAERVWPWLVQMGGYTRAGWYSLDRLDNGGRPSARRIIPALQELAVGDVMPTSADGSGFVVEALDPGRSLVLTIRRPDAVVSAAFVLVPLRAARTRLVTRVRFEVRPTPLALAWAAAMDVGDFVMFRQMMLGIRERAETAEHARPGVAPVQDLAPHRPLEYDIACVIRRDPADVYDLLAHKERYAAEPGSPVEALDRLDAGETRVGTRWVEVVPLLPGVRLTIRSMADRVVPGAALEERFSSAFFTGRLAYEFRAVPEGTRLRQRQSLRLRAPFRVFTSLVDRAFRARVIARMAEIRDALEADSA
jgi:hypothetical protein